MSQPARTFEDLLVWRKSHQLVLHVYRMTAEGFKRRGKSDKVRVMNIAQGSLEELRYYFVLAKDLGYAETDSERDQANEVARMLIGYIGALTGAR